jgi:hypothetical protein
MDISQDHVSNIGQQLETSRHPLNMSSSKIQTFDIFPEPPKELRLKVVCKPPPISGERVRPYVPSDAWLSKFLISLSSREIANFTAQSFIGTQCSAWHDPGVKTEMLAVQKPVYARDPPHPQCLMNLGFDTLFIGKTSCKFH